KYDSKSNVTQSACDLSKSEDLGKAIDALAAALTPLIMNPAMRFAMLITRAQVQNYYRPDYVDLYDLCGLLAHHCSSREVQTACINIQQVIKKERFVVANGSKGSAVRNSHGVSIYFPQRAKGVSSRISPLYHDLDFAQKFRWAAFLRAWLKSLGRPPRPKPSAAAIPAP
ncbi:MAG TPA: clostripain-related cysteine peptidase, partial [Candidatus Udaeobacter sp.]|nr:clostripain-related cysteine peptidase [Candidatus Udaeobacter sp.]